MKNLPAMQETQEIRVQSLGQEDPREEGMATHFLGCLENPMDRGAWQVIVHRVTKSWTQLKRLSLACTYAHIIEGGQQEDLATG